MTYDLASQPPSKVLKYSRETGLDSTLLTDIYVCFDSVKLLLPVGNDRGGVGLRVQPLQLSYTRTTLPNIANLSSS
jgi:hypothetical protein